MKVGPRLRRGRARRASGGATDGATAAEINAARHAEKGEHCKHSAEYRRRGGFTI